MDLNKFKGVFVALNTIYDKNDDVDTAAMQALVRIYREKGVRGVYVCGSTGEGFMMSTQERKRAAAAVVEAAGDDMTVIVHVGCASTKESVELARHCAEIGADAISAVPSVYYHLPAASVEKHWNAIIDATDLPFIIYNIPQLTSFDLSDALLKKFAENPKVIGVKNSAEPVCLMERYRTAAGDDFIIFNGSDEQYLAGRMMGADAGIGGTYGCMPELYIALEKAIQEGRYDDARVLQVKINDCIYALLSQPSLYGAVKSVMSLRFGIECGQPRLPLLPVDKKDVQFICDKIEKYVGELA